MKTFTPKIWNQIGLSLSILTGVGFATVQGATAASLTVAGYTWDAADSVVGGSIVSGSENISGFYANFLANQPEVASKTVGSILGFDPGVSTSVNLGDDTNRGVIELNWGNGMSLRNAAGKDLVVYENGSWGSPEAYAVSVRKVGSGSFSEFRYEFSDGFETNVFATGFDLSDFGIGNDEAIDAIRITNLLATDKVNGADGRGFLGGSFAPQTGGFGEGNYEPNKFDADLTFVAGLHKPTPVPEPTSALALLVFGVAGAGAVLKRR
ncbi:PEP-CTERM sorting domain-containing protein [Argonema galeatum]|uniref:PEP-CTERM sorting domain-containing protein n=1 Tax=Argonema galeatum TaxID=2942762 RepID=UPI002011057A|nr:PEP-CTERM sorting domain-containing protein [Argonema galeatum]MCL1466274.1 PEP-CTERM sorting domain-containing protein [Argonema galeatum A003/A1]